MDEYGERLPLDLGQLGLSVGCCPLAAPLAGETDGNGMAAVIQEALRHGVVLLSVTAKSHAHLEQLRGCLMGVDRAAYRLLLKVGPHFGLPDVATGAEAGAAVQEEACLSADVDHVLCLLGVTFIDIVVLSCARLAMAVEDGVCALQKMVNGGKVRFIGLSGATATSLQRANFVAPIHCIEEKWSLASPNLNPDVIHTCRELGIVVVASSPLHHGLLSDSASVEKSGGGCADISYAPQATAVAQLVDRLRPIAARQGCTVSQMALAWLRAQAARHWLEAVVPIPCTTSREHLCENMAALDFKLGRADLAEIGEVLREVETSAPT